MYKRQLQPQLNETTVLEQPAGETTVLEQPVGETTVLTGTLPPAESGETTVLVGGETHTAAAPASSGFTVDVEMSFTGSSEIIE